MKHTYTHFTAHFTESRLIFRGGPDTMKGPEAPEPQSVLDVKDSLAKAQAVLDDPNATPELKSKAQEAIVEYQEKLAEENELTDKMKDIIESNSGNKENSEQTKDRLMADLNEKAVNLKELVQKAQQHKGRLKTIQSPYGGVLTTVNSLTSQNKAGLENALKTIESTRNNVAKNKNVTDFAGMLKYATTQYNEVAQARGLTLAEDFDVDDFNPEEQQDRQEFVVNNTSESTNEADSKAKEQEEKLARATERVKNGLDTNADLETQIQTATEEERFEDVVRLRESQANNSKKIQSIMDQYGITIKTPIKSYTTELEAAKTQLLASIEKNNEEISRNETMKQIEFLSQSIQELGESVTDKNNVPVNVLNKLVNMRQKQVDLATDLQTKGVKNVPNFNGSLRLAQNLLSKALEAQNIANKATEEPQETLAVKIDEPAEIKPTAPVRIEASKQNPATKTMTVAADATIRVKFDSYANVQEFKPGTESMGDGVSSSNEYRIVRNGDQVTIESALPFTYEIDDPTPEPDVDMMVG